MNKLVTSLPSSPVPALEPSLEPEALNLPSPEQARLSAAEVSDVVAMAWQDDTPFEAIALQFGLTEAEVIALMRATLKARSFRVWRMRVRARPAKHQARQLSAQRLQSQGASSAATKRALDNVALEDFPLPPSPLSRASLS